MCRRPRARERRRSWNAHEDDDHCHYPLCNLRGSDEAEPNRDSYGAGTGMNITDIQPGTMLAQYEIVSRLGEGGMG